MRVDTVEDSSLKYGDSNTKLILRLSVAPPRIEPVPPGSIPPCRSADESVERPHFEVGTAANLLTFEQSLPDRVGLRLDRFGRGRDNQSLIRGKHKGVTRKDRLSHNLEVGIQLIEVDAAAVGV